MLVTHIFPLSVLISLSMAVLIQASDVLKVTQPLNMALVSVPVWLLTSTRSSASWLMQVSSATRVATVRQNATALLKTGVLILTAITSCLVSTIISDYPAGYRLYKLNRVRSSCFEPRTLFVLGITKSIISISIGQVSIMLQSSTPHQPEISTATQKWIIV